MPGRMGDKVVVVTGGAQGIGRACAGLLAEEGARVVIGDIQAEAGEQAAAAIRDAGGTAIFCRADVCVEEDCAALIAAAVASYGRLDGLVNNVGWFPRATLEETTTGLWEQIMNVNLRSAFYCCKYAFPAMQAAGGGSIVNIGSIHGIQGAPNLVAYSAAKGGLLTLTRTLAGSGAADRIRANYIIPGWVLTEGEIALQARAGISEEQLRQAGIEMRLGRQQTPRDTAYGILYLLSDESSQVTGIVLNIDAGHATLPHSPNMSTII